MHAAIMECSSRSSSADRNYLLAGTDNSIAKHKLWIYKFRVCDSEYGSTA